MAYRDDRQALALHVASLERENQRLRDQLSDSEDRYKRLRADDNRQRSEDARGGCVICGGTLLPVAIFAGKDRASLPLHISTIRFGDPGGGFTHSTPIQSKVCSSCGYIHSFLDLERTAQTIGVPPPDEQPEGEPEDDG